jgi:hypothetical protein
MAEELNIYTAAGYVPRSLLEVLTRLRQQKSNLDFALHNLMTQYSFSVAQRPKSALCPLIELSRSYAIRHKQILRHTKHTGRARLNERSASHSGPSLHNTQQTQETNIDSKP